MLIRNYMLMKHDVVHDILHGVCMTMRIFDIEMALNWFILRIYEIITPSTYRSMVFTFF
jgi:hypothetical protein